MIPRASACLLAITVVACVPARPDDSGDRSRADSGTDSNGAADTHTGDTDTGDTAAGRTCADLPWTQVELGWDFGCGIHTNGCVECWGSDALYNPVYKEPEVEAKFLAVHDQPYHDYENRERPSACVIDTDQRLTCWAMHDDHVVHETTEPVVDVAFGEYVDLAVLLTNGAMHAQGGQPAYPSVPGVLGPLVFGEGKLTAVRDGRLTQWDATGLGLEESDLGPVAEWLSYGFCWGSLCGIRYDGRGVLVRPYVSDWVEVFPAGSGWVALWSGPDSDYFLVQDSAGLVFVYDRVGGIASTTPWFTEPVVSVSSVQSASCGITADGWLECTGDMKDRFPPPGSYVLPR